MHKINTQLNEIKLVGISAKTSNANESNPSTAKIPLTLQKYFIQNTANKITNKKNLGTLFCVYTNYENDFNGAYTYFVGTEVTSFKNIDSSLEILTIAQQKYTKFTNQVGPIPKVCIDMWQQIWKMPFNLDGSRSYIADFEVYDERSIDSQNAILDIYVGIK